MGSKLCLCSVARSIFISDMNESQVASRFGPKLPYVCHRRDKPVEAKVLFHPYSLVVILPVSCIISGIGEWSHVMFTD